MSRILMVWLVLPLALGAGALSAQETTPFVGEMFFCSFHEGKGWDDFDTATALFKEAIDGMEGWDVVNAYVWRPYRSTIDFDLIWASYTPNINAWAGAEQAFLESGAGAVADAFWATVAECSSGLTMVELIHGTEQPESGNAAMPNALESFGCTRNEGTTDEELWAAIATWQKHVTKIGDNDPVYMRTPLVMDGPYDHGYFQVFENMEAWGASATRYLGDPGTKAVDAALGQVQDCVNHLWTSWQVIANGK